MQALPCLVSAALLSALAISAANCRHVELRSAADGGELEEVPMNSTPCSINAGRVCPSLEDTADYSIQLDASNFHAMGEIRVKVYKTLCELLGTVQSPWWYQVEVVEKLDNASSHPGAAAADQVAEDGGFPAAKGAFKGPLKTSELHLCHQDSTVVFSSCSPVPMDLPRHFTWKASAQYSHKDSLCFRLTLNFRGETSCNQKEVCVSLGEEVGGAGTSAEQQSSSSIITDDREEFQLDPGFLGNNGMDTVRVVNEERVMEIIGKNLLDEDDAEVIGPNDKGCFIAQALFADKGMSWMPDCDCSGYYKAVQCSVLAMGDEEEEEVEEIEERLECWCSTPSGSEIFNSRRVMDCQNPQTFEFRC